MAWNSQIRYNDLMHHSICARTYMFQMMPGPAVSHAATQDKWMQ